MVVDNLGVSDLAGVKELISQIEHSGSDILLNIAIKTTNPVFYDQLAELASVKVMIMKYLPMYSTGLLLNVLIQAMRSRFNIVIDSGVRVNSVADFLAGLKKSITCNTALYGRCLNTDGLSSPAPLGEAVPAEASSDNAGCYLESDIVVIPTGVLEEAGYFHEKLDWEAALRDYVVRLSWLGIATRGIDCPHITFEPLLSRLAKKHAAIGYKSHAYTAIYEKYFSEMVGDVKNILYIGERQYLQAINMFLEYFPNANVQCFVNRPEKSFTRCEMHHVNQAQRISISQALEAIGDIEFDLIIDNGGHTMRQTQTSLGVLFPRLVENGRYVIESMHVCPDTEGLLVKSSTQYVEGEETTTLELARMLRGDKELDFSKTFIQKEEAAYIRSHLADCVIEMGKVSEMVVMTRAGGVANLL